MQNHALLTRRSLLVGAGFMLPAAAQAQFGKIFKDVLGGEAGGLSDGKVVSGLKEALKISAENAVGITGREHGYFANEAIKILMPGKLRSAEKGLRMVGMGDKIDEFVLSMNRAAERAAPFAKSIFWDAIKEMTFSDARQILSGDDTAATQYFQRTTSERLTEAFQPIVSETMEEVGVTRQYKQLMGSAQSIPFMKTEALDIDAYVVGKSLDGLFHVLGEEETKIRKNPAARVTPILKEVFGQS